MIATFLLININNAFILKSMVYRLPFGTAMLFNQCLLVSPSQPRGHNVYRHPPVLPLRFRAADGPLRAQPAAAAGPRTSCCRPA